MTGGTEEMSKINKKVKVRKSDAVPADRSQGFSRKHTHKPLGECHQKISLPGPVDTSSALSSKPTHTPALLTAIFVCILKSGVESKLQ